MFLLLLVCSNLVCVGVGVGVGVGVLPYRIDFCFILVGEVQAEFHALNVGSEGATLPLVHIDNLAAISGVSRFGEQRHRFR